MVSQDRVRLGKWFNAYDEVQTNSINASQALVCSVTSSDDGFDWTNIGSNSNLTFDDIISNEEQNSSHYDKCSIVDIADLPSDNDDSPVAVVVGLSNAFLSLSRIRRLARNHLDNAIAKLPASISANASFDSNGNLQENFSSTNSFSECITTPRFVSGDDLPSMRVPSESATSKQSTDVQTSEVIVIEGLSADRLNPTPPGSGRALPSLISTVIEEPLFQSSQFPDGSRFIQAHQADTSIIPLSPESAPDSLSSGSTLLIEGVATQSDVWTRPLPTIHAPRCRRAHAYRYSLGKGALQSTKMRPLFGCEVTANSSARFRNFRMLSLLHRRNSAEARFQRQEKQGK